MPSRRWSAPNGYKEGEIHDHFIDDNDEVGVEFTARPNLDALEQKFNRLRKQRRILKKKKQNADLELYWWRNGARWFLIALIMYCVYRYPRQKERDSTLVEPLKTIRVPTKDIPLEEHIPARLMLKDSEGRERQDTRLLVPVQNTRVERLPPPFQNMTTADFSWLLDNPWHVLNYDMNYNFWLTRSDEPVLRRIAREDLDTYVEQHLQWRWNKHGDLCRRGARNFPLFNKETCDLAVKSYTLASETIKNKKKAKNARKILQYGTDNDNEIRKLDRERIEKELGYDLDDKETKSEVEIRFIGKEVLKKKLEDAFLEGKLEENQ